MRFLTLLCWLIFITIGNLGGQTLEELKAEQATKKGEVAAIQSEIDAIQTKINALPGWRTGAFGTIGFNLSSFRDWYGKETVNSSSGNIGFTVNGYANLIQEKFFWRNGGNMNLAWVKFDNEDDPSDNGEFQKATDVFSINSLYGRKLNEKIAISTLAEYRTNLLTDFNDPGYLDLGLGGTWTPILDLIVVFHPLNYNFIFSNADAVYESSLGLKMVADYTKQLPNGISWKSNLSAFMSYEESSNLSNWIWVNGFGMKIWKGFGVGFEVGLRQNKQEELDYELNTLGNPSATFDNIDNALQTYWLIGLSYGF